MHDQQPQAPQPPNVPHAPASNGQDDHARFMWSVAGGIVSGLLANPGKHHCSVKDSISLFDEVLYELNAYARVRGDFSEWVSDQSAVEEPGRKPAPGAPLAEAPAAGQQAPRPYVMPSPAAEIRQPAPGPSPSHAPYGHGGGVTGAGSVPGFTPSLIQGPMHGGMPVQPGHNVSAAGPALGTDRPDVSMELPDLPLPPAEGH
ncbi:MAG: hypothetical protein H7123_09105 [Thermoleophilia bacterium]|nr:hypothetical protein [Thermoleophilia bacterium]